MPWFGRKNSVITVDFYESDKNIPFATVKHPIEQLPDTFEISTTLTIQGQQWSVMDATPKTKSEFSKTGKLKLILSKITMIDHRELLFSLPSINDKLCEFIESDSLGEVLMLHEDDWRQIEFIGKSYENQVKEEMLSIRNIYDLHRKGIGFDHVHVRKAIEKPFSNNSLTFEAMEKQIKISEFYNNFSFEGYNGKAKNGFAFKLSNDINIYGQFSEGNRIQYLCTSTDKGLKEEFGKLMKDNNLLCVNWCKMEIIKPE